MIISYICSAIVLWRVFICWACKRLWCFWICAYTEELMIHFLFVIALHLIFITTAEWIGNVYRLSGLRLLRLFGVKRIFSVALTLYFFLLLSRRPLPISLSFSHEIWTNQQIAFIANSGIPFFARNKLCLQLWKPFWSC